MQLRPYTLVPILMLADAMLALLLTYERAVYCSNGNHSFSFVLSRIPGLRYNVFYQMTTRISILFVSGAEKSLTHSFPWLKSK